MIFGLFKPFKMLDLYTSGDVSLLYQTSDKRLLGTNGNGIEFLTGFKTKSTRSSDLHSGRAEVRTESLLSKSINLRMIVMRSKEMLIKEAINWKEPRFPKFDRRGRLSSDNQTLSSLRQAERSVENRWLT
jgi:hypothetical protein